MGNEFIEIEKVKKGEIIKAKTFNQIIDDLNYLKEFYDPPEFYYLSHVKEGEVCTSEFVNKIIDNLNFLKEREELLSKYLGLIRNAFPINYRLYMEIPFLNKPILEMGVRAEKPIREDLSVSIDILVKKQIRKDLSVSISVEIEKQ